MLRICRNPKIKFFLSTFLCFLVGRYVTYLTLPVAIIVGSVGYYAERHFFSTTSPTLEYLEKSLSEERRKIIPVINEENAITEAGKLKLHAPLSLYVNTPSKTISKN